MYQVGSRLPLGFDRSSSIATSRSYIGHQDLEAETINRIDQIGSDDRPEDDDALQEIVMAVDIKERGTVGCAYFVAAEGKLYLMEEVKLGGPDVVESSKLIRYTLGDALCLYIPVKLFVEPTVILHTSRLDDAVIQKLDPSHVEMGDNDSR